MDAEKFTKKSLEVIESCEKLAYEYNNQELTQAHLMYALVTVEDSLIAKLLTNMGINMDAFTGECEKLVANRPKVSGGQLFTSPEFSKALIQAEKEAKQMGDDYISVEHIFLGLLEKADKDIKRVINAYGITRGKFLEVLANIRGNRKVESDNPEDTYDALNKYPRPNSIFSLSTISCACSRISFLDAGTVISEIDTEIAPLVEYL